MRRPLQGEMVLAQEDDGQQVLGFIEADRKGGKRITGYEYAVLVTNLDHEILSVGRRTEHAGQTTITLTGQHAYFDKARRVLMRVSRQLQACVSEATEKLNSLSVWLPCCDHLKRTLAAIGPPAPLRLLTDHANGVG